MRHLTSISLLLISYISIGQIQQGSLLADISLSYSQTKIENDFSQFSTYVRESTSKNFIISQNFSFLVSNKSAVGFGVSYNSNSIDYTYADSGFGDPAFADIGEKQHMVSLSGHYELFVPIIGRLFFSPKGRVSYGIGQSTYNRGGEFKKRLSLLSIMILPKINYFLGEKWNLNFGIGAIGYSMLFEKPDEDGISEDLKNTKKTFSAEFGSESISLGIGYRFK